MRDETVAGFLKDLGEKKPTPGGGAVSGLNGAIAAAQLKMICEYTKNEDINAKAEYLARKVETFLDLADSDSMAFIKVSEAYRSDSKEQINSALMDAIEPSLNIIKNCEELTDYCEKNFQTFNPRLKADFVVVLANIKASVRSAKAMIQTNLDSLKEINPQNIKDSINECNELLLRADALYKEIGA